MTVLCPGADCAIDYKEVVFSYRDSTRGIHGVPLTIDSDCHVALIGKSGSGKSTLSGLLVRLIDPQSGEILLGGRRLTDYSLNALRKLICYVPQSPILFSGSIRENLLFGNSYATPGEITDAIDTAGLDRMLCLLPRGLDTHLGSNAAGLSGGEQQRLALARALLRKSEVLILDESTSALDLPTESVVFERIARTRRKRSLILASHRVRSVTWVDRIVVLHSCAVVAQGTATNLHASCPLYRELLESTPALVSPSASDHRLLSSDPRLPPQT